MKKTMKQYEKSAADQKLDKAEMKRGVKEGSKADRKIDKGEFAAWSKKKP